MQSLGGTYTLMTESGQMVRLAGKDADAIGREPPPALHAEAAPTTTEAVEKLVWGQLATCFDPEIPVNIVELGLVYRCQVAPLPEGGYKVDVRFTLTAPGCGMGEVLKTDIRNKILSVPGVKEVAAEVVFDPPWSREKMSEGAKLQLGLI
jgi:probable FeS assembly SUF system protein SufT